MKKRFKSKRPKHKLLFFYIIIIILFGLFSYYLIIKINKKYLLLEDYKVLNIPIDKNKLLFKNSFNMYLNKRIDTNTVFYEVPIFNNKKIYIYNTHQNEEYINFDVYNASLYLKDELSKYDIDALVEDTNISEKRKELNYNYSQSYRITKELLSKVINDNYSLYIDLHRDSSKKKTSTTTIDNINYARIMFVIGKNHDGYENNYKVADELNKMLKNINPSISRGILTRQNSNYNQELDKNIILIEIGGPENTEEEVKNTLKILAKSIGEFLNE